MGGLAPNISDVDVWQKRQFRPDARIASSSLTVPRASVEAVYSEISNDTLTWLIAPKSAPRSFSMSSNDGDTRGGSVTDLGKAPGTA